MKKIFFPKEKSICATLGVADELCLRSRVEKEDETQWRHKLQFDDDQRCCILATVLLRNGSCCSMCHEQEKSHNTTHQQHSLRIDSLMWKIEQIQRQQRFFLNHQ